MDTNGILDFVKRQKICVVATVNQENKPESAVVEFGQTDNFEIILDIYNTSRKYKNMKANPAVSLAIGWNENITVQYEGLAQELSGEEKVKY